MASSKPLLVSIIVLFITLSSTNAQQRRFNCSTAGATCNALIDYVSPNATTLSTIKTLFNIKNIRSILGANNLPLSTPANSPVAANQTLKIPFPCICSNGTGISNNRPYYTVVPDDTLYHIAAEVFMGLITPSEIQSVNNISDINLIVEGQKFRIPLPCSCDDVDGQQVVHYGHVVPAGSSLSGIAQQYNTSQDTLQRLNNIRPEELQAGSVLDVPLRACSSTVNNSSKDYPLLLANDTYVFTAMNCVMCKCNGAMNWMLECEPSNNLNASCPSIQCAGGSDNLYLGNTTTSGCNRTRCSYAGYNQNIQTILSSESTCPASNNGSSAIRLQGRRSNEVVVIFIHIVLLCIAFLIL